MNWWMGCDCETCKAKRNGEADRSDRERRLPDLLKAARAWSRHNVSDQFGLVDAVDACADIEVE